MPTFADAGGLLFAGSYLVTAPVVLVDGPQPGPADAMWLFGLGAAYTRGRRLGGYIDQGIDVMQNMPKKSKKSIEELKWTPKKQQLQTPQPLERPALHSGLWHVRMHAKKKKRTLRGLYA